MSEGNVHRVSELDNTYYKRLLSFMEETKKESDRGKALVCASLIDEMIAEILLSFFINKKISRDMLYSNNAPLHSLYAKNLLAYSLGLTSPSEYQDIELVRKVRNKFAHSMSCSFSDEKIFSWCSSLRTGMHKLDVLPRGHKSRVDDPRARFAMVTISLVSDLYNRAHYTAQKRRNELPDDLKFLDQVLDNMKNENRGE